MVAGEGAKFCGAGEGESLHVLELHADADVCGLFRLSGQVQGVPRPSDDEIFHRDRDDRVLLLQTSGTRCSYHLPSRAVFTGACVLCLLHMAESLIRGNSVLIDQHDRAAGK